MVDCCSERPFRKLTLVPCRPGAVFESINMQFVTRWRHSHFLYDRASHKVRLRVCLVLGRGCFGCSLCRQEDPSHVVYCVMYMK